MAKRKIDARRVKIHRSYTIAEAANLLRVHKHTVQTWISRGMPCISDRRPYLVTGSDLKEFLQQRRQLTKAKCAPGHLYCLKCRAPRRPAAGMLDYLPITLVSGNLRGICHVCDTLIFRRVALANISSVAPGCDVAFPQGQQCLTDQH